MLYSATATPTITTRFGGTDGGELAAIALSGGVAHPSGYPTYLWLARLVITLTSGEAAARLARFSALAGAAAVGGTAALLLLTQPAHQPRAWRSIGVAIVTGFALAASPRLWSQSIIVEVYALALVWLVLAVALSYAWLRSGRWWLLALTTLVTGIGLGSHLTLAAVLPALAVAWLVTPRRPRIPPFHAAIALATLLAGASVYALLPVWAARDPMPTWGDPATLGGWWTHVTGAEYRYLVGIVPWTQRLSRIGVAARDLLAQPGVPGVVLAIGWGIPHGWRTQRPLSAMLAVIALSSLAFAISYGGADGTVYLLPWTWCWYVWLGLGLDALAQQDFVQHRRLGARLGIYLMAITALLGPAYRQYPQFDLHADTSERDWIVGQLQALPADAIVTSTTDRLTFGGWYAQTALGARPDVSVIDMRLLQQAWYERQIRAMLGGSATTRACTFLAQTDRPIYRLNDQQELVPTRPPPCDPARN